MSTSQPRPPDPAEIRTGSKPGVCQFCRSSMPAGRLSPVCGTCCQEFNARSAAAARITQPVLRRATRFHWFAVAIALGFAMLLVAIGINAAIQRNPSPPALNPTFRVIQFVLLVASLWICVELDAAARQFPVLPWIARSRAGAVIRRMEGLAPGASLATLAVLLPWAIGIYHRSPGLLVVYLTLSCATIAAAAALWSRTRAYERMRVTCQAELSQQRHAWRSIGVHRRGVIAAAVWLVASVLIAMLPVMGIGRPYSENGFPWQELAAWRAVRISLLIAALLWFVAFIDATRSLRRWIPHGP